MAIEYRNAKNTEGYQKIRTRKPKAKVGNLEYSQKHKYVDSEIRYQIKPAKRDHLRLKVKTTIEVSNSIATKKWNRPLQRRNVTIKSRQLRAEPVTPQSWKILERNNAIIWVGIQKHQSG